MGNSNTEHYRNFQSIVKEKIPPSGKEKPVEVDLEKEAEFDYDWLTKEDY